MVKLDGESINVRYWSLCGAPDFEIDYALPSGKATYAKAHEKGSYGASFPVTLLAAYLDIPSNQTSFVRLSDLVGVGVSEGPISAARALCDLLQSEL